MFLYIMYIDTQQCLDIYILIATSIFTLLHQYSHVLKPLHIMNIDVSPSLPENHSIHCIHTIIWQPSDINNAGRQEVD